MSSQIPSRTLILEDWGVLEESENFLLQWCNYAMVKKNQVLTFQPLEVFTLELYNSMCLIFWYEDSAILNLFTVQAIGSYIKDLMFY